MEVSPWLPLVSRLEAKGVAEKITTASARNHTLVTQLLNLSLYCLICPAPAKSIPRFFNTGWNFQLRLYIKIHHTSSMYCYYKNNAKLLIFMNQGCINCKI
jgi:hypothetical protein